MVTTYRVVLAIERQLPTGDWEAAHSETLTGEVGAQEAGDEFDAALQRLKPAPRPGMNWPRLLG